MQTISGKAEGLAVTPPEWNSMADELEGLILSVGLALAGGDTAQARKAIATYAATSDYYTDSGAADAYVLTPIGTLSSPDAYADGMRIRFRADNANTGASTVNVNSLGAVNLTRPDGSALQAADITTLRDVVARYDAGGAHFRMEVPSFLRVSTVGEIQTAISALPSTGGTVDARSIRGTATIGTLITVDKPVTILLGDCVFTVTASQAFQLGDEAKLIGAGMGRTFLFHGNSAGSSDTPIVRNVDFTNGNTGIEIAHLTIDGNKSNQGATTDIEAVRVQHTTDLNLHHVEAINTVGVALKGFQPKLRNYIRFNRCSNFAPNDTAKGGIVFNRSTTTGEPTDTLVIEDNYVDGQASSSGCIGVAASNTSTMRSVSIKRNRCIIGTPVGSTINFGVEVFADDSAAAFVYDFEVDDNTILGESSSNTFLFGISVSGREIATGTIRGNRFRDCGGRSIEVVCGEVDVSGNVERNCGGIIYDVTNVGGATRDYYGVGIRGNIVITPQRTDGGIIVTSDDHGIIGFVIADNHVRTPAGNGLNLLGPMEDCRVAGNVVSDSTSAAAGSHAIACVPNTGRPQRIQFEDNTIIDWNPGSGGSGIRVNGDDCRLKLNHYQNVTTPTTLTSSTGTREVGYINSDELIVEGIIEVSSGHLVTVTADTLTLDEYAPFDYEIIDLRGITSVGSIDVSIEINGTPVTGMDTVTVDTTQDTLTATAANAVSAGDRVTLVLENPVSSPQDFAFTLRTRRV